MDIIERSAKIFDHVIVAVLINSSKTPAFSVEEKMHLIKKATIHLHNVEVDNFEGLLVDYVKSKDVNVVVRGLRAVSDFEHEFSMAAANSHMYGKMETVFMMTRTDYSFLSSSIVKDIAQNGGKIDGLVPVSIVGDIVSKYQKRS